MADHWYVYDQNEVKSERFSTFEDASDAAELYWRNKTGSNSDLMWMLDGPNADIQYRLRVKKGTGKGTVYAPTTVMVSLGGLGETEGGPHIFWGAVRDGMAGTTGSRAAAIEQPATAPPFRGVRHEDLMDYYEEAAQVIDLDHIAYRTPEIT